MISPETLRTLEFDRILATLAGFAHSDATRAEVLAIRPLADREAIVARFGQVEEIRRLASLNIGLPLASFRDIGPSLELVRPAGAILNPDELLVFLPVLRILAAIARQFGCTGRSGIGTATSPGSCSSWRQISHSPASLTAARSAADFGSGT